ncbi:MAG: nucleotidyltransferase domain-containing protein [Leptospiraceae bacterium]|nr:nucleotidyltransferase domain-containing protein [Leptospiraceae bacterium]
MQELISDTYLTKNISFDENSIVAFCKKWKVKEFYFFGSVLSEKFSTQKSDVDVMIEFNTDAKINLFHHMDMQTELENIFKKKVDLVTKTAVENSQNQYRKTSVLKGSKLFYYES